MIKIEIKVISNFNLDFFLTIFYKNQKKKPLTILKKLLKVIKF